MLEVLNVLEDKEDYEKYFALVKRFTKDTDILRIQNAMGEYYKETGDTDIDWSGFSTYFLTKNPALNAGKQEEYKRMFEKLRLSSGTSLKRVLIETFLQRYHAERIGFMSLEVAEGKRSDLNDIQLELDQYLDASGKATEIGAEANRKDLEQLLETTSASHGLEWRLQALRDSFGPLRKGNFALFAGRPDSGKTTLLCSEGSYMAPQLPPEERLIYFTNEEGGDPVKIRMITSVLGIDRMTLEKDKKRYWNEYLHIIGGDPDKILIIDKYDLHVKDIEYWLQHETPGLVCIDQLRKVHGFEDMKGVNRLEKLFQLGREWSKAFAPVLTVSQLDAYAENEQWPGMSRLYESKTAVQGEMDGIVTIGHVDGSMPQARYLNIVKNKFPTPGDPMQRHGKHEVFIRADIARYTDS